MPFVFVRHQVKDQAHWKKFFDQDEQMLKECGCKNFQLFRDVDRPHEVLVLMEWDKFENARFFFNSERLSDLMGNAGVVGEPSFYYLEKEQAKSLVQESAQKINAA